MKYQLRCPNCGNEFPCDEAKYDIKIKQVGAEIKKNTYWFAYYNTLTPGERTALSGKRREMLVIQSRKQEELAELKAIRNYINRATERGRFEIFKKFVCQKLGKEEFMKLIEQMEKESEAYRTSDLMKHEYTRSRSKPGCISINKL